MCQHFGEHIDPQQQNQVAAMIASMGVVAALMGLAVAAFFIFLFWRIFTKAGLAGPLALIAIVPVFGPIVVLCILAFSQWRVAPIPPGYVSGPPSYPPTGYPPAHYPPAEPPTQL